MPKSSRRTVFPSRPVSSNANVTSAVGTEETFGRRRARRSSLLSRTIIWVTGLICLAFLLATLAQAWSNSQLMQRVRQQQQQLQQTQEHNAYLKKLANHYKDPSVIEREAREELGYIRRGEHAVVIVSEDNQAQPASPHPTQRPAPQSYWQQWWNVFFGNG